MKALICSQCGAGINSATFRCDYCGTSYQSDYLPGMLTVVHERCDIRKIRGQHIVPMEWYIQSPERISADMMKEIASDIGVEAMKLMSFRSRIDPLREAVVIDGELKVVGGNEW